jgi:hypothetical protein
MDHVYFKHEKCDNPGRCQYCDGGLAFCIVCRCGEAELPTECPGHKISPSDREDIMEGRLDFKNGEWHRK